MLSCDLGPAHPSRMKELELEDKQYEIDKELNDLTSMEGWLSEGEGVREGGGDGRQGGA